MEPHLTIEQVNQVDVGCFKFVKVGDEYRFVANGAVKHIDLVDFDELDEVKGGGIIFVFPTHWKFESKFSETLFNRVGIRASFHDADELKQLITREYRDDY